MLCSINGGRHYQGQLPGMTGAQARLWKGFTTGSDFIPASEQEGGRGGYKIRPQQGGIFQGSYIGAVGLLREVTMETVKCAWLQDEDTVPGLFIGCHLPLATEAGRRLAACRCWAVRPLPHAPTPGTCWKLLF